MTKTGQSLITVFLGGRGTIHWWILVFWGGGGLGICKPPPPWAAQRKAKTGKNCHPRGRGREKALDENEDENCDDENEDENCVPCQVWPTGLPPR